MANLLFFDVATTDIPKWQEPSEQENQPHIVCLAAALVDEETLIVQKVFSDLVKHEDWKSEPDALLAHGITTEDADILGVLETQVLDQFLDMVFDKNTQLRVAHSIQFDDRIIRIALKRYRGDSAANAYRGGNKFCTMAAARPIMNLMQMGSNRKKNPSLDEAFSYFVGQPRQPPKIEKPGDGILDNVLTTIEVYRGLRNHHSGKVAQVGEEVGL